jgi:GAF domain-containing protein
MYATSVRPRRGDEILGLTAAKRLPRASDTRDTATALSSSADKIPNVFEVRSDPNLSEGERYRDLEAALVSLMDGEMDALANLANAAALLAHSLEAINWCGFYLLRGEELVLGPFQGKPACIRIPLGRGVCGRAALERATLVVPDVSRFPDHITCDPASRSEIVVPIIEGDVLRGVLDVDAPEVGRFDREDLAGLERFVAALAPRIKWERL